MFLGCKYVCFCEVVKIVAYVGRIRTCLDQNFETRYFTTEPLQKASCSCNAYLDSYSTHAFGSELLTGLGLA